MTSEKHTPGHGDLIKRLLKCAADQDNSLENDVWCVDELREAAAALAEEQKRSAALLEALNEQTALVDRLLTIVECQEADIGCESPDAIWPLLGPSYEKSSALISQAEGRQP